MQNLWSCTSFPIQGNLPIDFRGIFTWVEVENSSMMVKELMLVFSCPGFMRKRVNQKLFFHIKWF